MKIVNKYLNPILALLIIITGIFWGYNIVVKAQISEIAFPVAELGNCANEEECKSYCDKDENMSVCIDFAEKNGLMSSEDAKRARAVDEIGEGPGGCKNKEECETYCNSTSHINECLAFAKEHDLMSEKELEEAEKVAEALSKGAELPGRCTNKEDCETYCNDMSHINECLAFAEKAGLISDDELEDAKKVAKAMASGLTPPGNCKGKEECEAYCSEEDHMEECMNFGVAAGFIPKNEVENAKKMMSLMQSGNTPGGCKGKEECETYCSDSTHMEECMNFAKEAGLINKEEMGNMDEGMNKMKEMINNAPSEAAECLKTNLGTELIEKIQSGDYSSTNENVGETIKKCFEQYYQSQGFETMEGRREINPEQYNNQQDNHEYKPIEGTTDICQSKEECASYYKNYETSSEGNLFNEMMEKGIEIMKQEPFTENYNQQYQEQYKQYYEQKSLDYYNQEMIDKNYNYITPEGTVGYPVQYYPQLTTDINTYTAPSETNFNQTYTAPTDTDSSKDYSVPTESIPTKATNLGSNLYKILLKLIGK